VKTINPKLELDSIPAQIPMEALEWISKLSGPRIAAVNTFGMSGTNVHAILKEAPFNWNNFAQSSGISQIIPISAKSPESLNELRLD